MTQEMNKLKGKRKKSLVGWMPKEWNKFCIGLPFYTAKKDCIFEQEQKVKKVRIIIEEVK